ncbi:MAG: 5'-3' exonuclease H3TH domain-containing protein, partial [Bacteroidota bacterium]
MTPVLSPFELILGVLLGFTSTLLEVIQKQKPTHLAVAFDTSAPTFRHERFEEYKANREETPEDIRIGVPIVKDIVKAFNIPCIELDGYEADDIIGTIAKKAARNGFEVFMMTPDKDYGQLVEEHVYLYKPAFMGNAVDIMGVPEVLAKWDIEQVDQVIDMLGLQGDSVDNIPGIPGIGPKTASKLLKTYGSVENLVANVEDLKGKQKENVQNFAEQGLLSKELATINIEVPVEFNEKELEYDGPDEEKLKPIFEELEFRTLIKRVFGETASTTSSSSSGDGQLDMFSQASKEAINIDEATQPAEKLTVKTSQHEYFFIDSSDKRKELVAFLAMQDEYCFDTETTGIDAVEAEVVGLSFSYVEGEAYYIAVPAEFEEAKSVIQEFKEVLENEKIIKIAQNVKYDMLVLKKYDVHVSGPIFDTMLAHYIIEPETKHNMDAMAEQYLNYTPISITTLLGPKGKNQKNMRDIDPEEITDYASEDA